MKAIILLTIVTLVFGCATGPGGSAKSSKPTSAVAQQEKAKLKAELKDIRAQIVHLDGMITHTKAILATADAEMKPLTQAELKNYQQQKSALAARRQELQSRLESLE